MLINGYELISKCFYTTAIHADIRLMTISNSNCNEEVGVSRMRRFNAIDLYISVIA